MIWVHRGKHSSNFIYKRKRIVKKLMLSMNLQSKSLVSWTKGKNDSIQVGHLEFPPMRSFRPISDETVTSKYFQYTALRVVFGMTSNVNHWLRRFRAMPKNTTLGLKWKIIAHHVESVRYVSTNEMCVPWERGKCAWARRNSKCVKNVRELVEIVRYASTREAKTKRI